MPDESLELARVSREIVFRVAAECFDGHLPENPFAIVDAIAAILPAEMSAEKKEECKPYLYVAVCQYQAMDNRLPL